MSDIEFTQYMMPHGRQQIVKIDRPEQVVTRANELIKQGYFFECEMLSDYKTISLTIVNDKGDQAIEIVANGPEVPQAVDRMILGFYGERRGAVG